MTATPSDGTVYQASDNRWYRWPDPTPYTTREAAEAGDTSAPEPTRGPGGRPPTARPVDVSGGTGSTGIWRATAYVAAVFVLLPAVLGILGYLLLPDSHGPGGCEGIGFGCTPAPNDTAGLIAAFALLGTVPAVASAPVVMWVGARLFPWFRDASAVRKAVMVSAVYGAGGVIALVIALISNRPS